MTRISVTPAIAPAANWYWKGSAGISSGSEGKSTFYIGGRHCGLGWGELMMVKINFCQVGAPRNFPDGKLVSRRMSEPCTPRITRWRAP